MSAFNDPESVRRQYATYDNLRVRQEIHDTYTVPQFDHTRWVIKAANWRGDEAVLDVGSGAGRYYDALTSLQPNVTYYGLDLSPGMIIKHPASGDGRLLIADAGHIPYQDNAFDVIMANHMMYHLPDIDEALVEFRRVLKPEGVLLVATNSVQSMPELQVLMRRAIVLLTRTGASQVQPPLPASHRFALENGSRQLARHFFAVVRHEVPSKLVFTDIEPVMRYLETTREMREPQLPEDVLWDDVMMIMQQQITHLIHHLGELIITKSTGVLVASDTGDFIAEFVQRQQMVAS
jgi:SAM-dependent methyltransferase